MCRWGCETSNTTYMCKWCGTWFCKHCLRGQFWGQMSEPLKCRICFQKKCQGTRVDFVEHPPEMDNKGRKSVGDLRARNSLSSASAKNKTGNRTKSKEAQKSGMKKKK